MSVMTRGTRIQLGVFAVIAVVAVSWVSFRYVGLASMVGIGQMEITIRAADATGVPPGADVSFRGVSVGRVSDVRLSGEATEIRLSISDDVAVPRDVVVEIHSASAIGEPYLDLVPQSAGAPYLGDGDTLAGNLVVPLPGTEKMVGDLTDLARSVDGDDVEVVLDQIAAATDGAEQDWRRLVGAGGELVAMANAESSAVTSFVDQLELTLRSQADVAPQIGRAASHLDRALGELAQGRGDLSELLPALRPMQRGLSRLIERSGDDLAVILHDLVSVGQVVKTYRPGVEQILVLYPPTVAALQAATSPIGGASEGAVHLALRPNIEQPPTCYQGFLPVRDQRDFNDLRPRDDVPDDLYCKVAADDPRAVRGARNSPCLNAPGVRAASVEQCLGRKIGETREPLRSPRRIQTYDPATGRVLMAEGTTFHIAGMGRGKKREVERWQDLVLG